MSDPYARRPHRPGYSSQRAETRRDVEAAMAARVELGPEYEEHIAASLADRIEELTAYRSAELRHADRDRELELQAEKSARTQRFVLGMVSLVAGIPITGIAATTVEPSLLGVMMSWAGIVGINAVHALASRPRRR
jgi:hypothetical protein